MCYASVSQSEESINAIAAIWLVRKVQLTGNTFSFNVLFCCLWNISDAQMPHVLAIEEWRPSWLYSAYFLWTANCASHPLLSVCLPLPDLEGETPDMCAPRGHNFLHFSLPEARLPPPPENPGSATFWNWYIKKTWALILCTHRSSTRNPGSTSHNVHMYTHITYIERTWALILCTHRSSTRNPGSTSHNVHMYTHITYIERTWAVILCTHRSSHRQLAEDPNNDSFDECGCRVTQTLNIWIANGGNWSELEARRTGSAFVTGYASFIKGEVSKRL